MSGRRRDGCGGRGVDERCTGPVGAELPLLLPFVLFHRGGKVEWSGGCAVPGRKFKKAVRGTRLRRRIIHTP